MPYRHNIRFRIFLSYPVLGLLVSLIVIIFFVFSFMQLEKRFLKDFLTEELNHFIELTHKNPELTQQKARNWVAIKTDPLHPIDFLQPLTTYLPGVYDVFIEGRIFDIAVAENNGTRYYLIYDDSKLEALEESLLAYMIAGAFIIVWAATGYGIWFSKQVIKPIINLANRVRVLSDEGSKRALAPDYANDEIGFLASEFDAYIQRIHELILREKEFTGNASHELRTPLAVILVACEGLLLRQNLPDDIKQRVRRIERSAEEMKNRLEVLLILARNPEQQDIFHSQTELEPLLNHIIDDHASSLSPSVRVITKIRGRPVISAPYTILSMTFGNLIKNAFSHTTQGSVIIEANATGVKVIDTGRGIPQDQMEHIFERGFKGDFSDGQGLGLALVRRICDYYHWQLEIDSVPEQGTSVRVKF